MRVYIYILIIAGVVMGMKSVYPKAPVPIPVLSPIFIIKPTPIAKPTPATIEDWSNMIAESPTAEKFATKTGVVKLGDKAVYPIEKIIQADGKAVRWVKTYRMWTRNDGKVIPLSNGWTAQAVLSEIIVKPIKIIPEVMK